MIQFDRVSKRYSKRPRTLHEALRRVFGGYGAGCVPGSLLASEFWALRDVSFEVERGETLGIIGQNGAGKSTILKLIAGITAPSSGHIAVTGRVGCLIELGAGFNPELTGAENIFLNGTLLGLRRKEISQKFDQIVAFSGLQDFLSVPVKYYSSGMYAKLGFSVAAHVDADIVLTDEILAVGDAAFQRQCFEKFQDLKASTTIVFVSHDLTKVRQMCTRAVWLNHGRVECAGDPEKVIDAYMQWVQQDRESHFRATTPAESKSRGRRRGSGEVEIIQVTTHDAHGQSRSVFRTSDELVVRIRYRTNGRFRNPGFGVNIIAQDDTFVHGTNTFQQNVPVKLADGEGMIEVHYSRLPLLEGTYRLMVGVTSDNNWAAPYDLREEIEQFEVLRTCPDSGHVHFEHVWRQYA